MADAVRSGSVFFDIGAQAGYHTLLASQLVGPTGQVFAFEPVPSNAAIIRKHIALNALSNVTVIEAAVSDLDGTLQFDTGANSVSGHLSIDGNLSVRTLTLDREIERGALPEPDFVKIDVEGAEAKVLTGGRKLLTRRHPALLIETHQWMPVHESSRRDCCQLLAALGYELLQGDSSALNSAYHVYARAASVIGAISHT
jgi:FkbM family methyltransferase